MNRLIPLTASFAIALLAPRDLHAQAAPSTPSATGEEAIKLDPFSVNADSDVGFVAASSLAGGRIATALKDTPVAYSVLTKEFLDAFNLTDTAEASNFSVNVQNTPNDGSQQGFGGNGALWGAGSSDIQSFQVRGQPVSTPQRNFFPYANTSDSFNLDRLDLTRGPNAVLFGQGQGGGAINTVTKQAVIGREIQELRLQIGSWDRYRVTADVNKPINNQLAVRANVLWATGNTWRDNEWEDKRGFHFTTTYKPTPRLTIRAEGEYINTKRAAAWQVFQDFVSGWDGVTISTAPDPTRTASQLARQGLIRTPLNFTYHPAYGKEILNFENRFSTQNAKYNANPTLTGYLNGTPVATVNFGATTGAGSPLYPMEPIWNLPNQFKTAAAGSPYFRIPRRNENMNWTDPTHDAPTYTEYGRDVSLTAAYNIGDSLFFEVAGDINRSPRMGRNDGRRGINLTQIDLDRTLPTGAPNPGFLKLFSDAMYYRNLRAENYRNLRAHVLYAANTRFGRLQTGLMGGWQEQENIALGDTLLLPLTWRAPDARVWNQNSGLANNIYGLHRRTYLGENLPNGNFDAAIQPFMAVDPVTNTRELIKPIPGWVSAQAQFNNIATRTSKFAQVAANMDLFKNRLVLIAAGRRDVISLNQIVHKVSGDYPVGWYGQYITPAPPAPADFETLSYVPKNTNGVVTGPKAKAVTRPRISVGGVNLPAPQYANERFQDDYGPPDVTSSANTFTLGTVVNVTRLIGVYVNRSSTFNPTASAQLARDYFGAVLKPATSYGLDTGVRLTLPNGKLSASVAYFEGVTKNTTQAGQSFDVSPLQGYTQYIQVPRVGNLNAIGDNQHNIAAAGTATRDRKNWGYEMEVTANLTSSWRVIFNAGTTYLRTSSAFSSALPFIASLEPTVKLQLQDAGIVFDGQNRASINPAVNNPTMINVTAVQAAVDAWNTQHDVTIPALIDIATNGVRVTTDTGWRANLATDYRIASGPARGLRVGLAVNFFPKLIAGNRANETIRDPANPALAIDDPAMGAGDFVRTPSYYTTKGSLSYNLKLGEGTGRFRPKSIQLDLSIDNLLNNRRTLWFPNASGSIASTDSVVYVPRSGDVSDPSRIRVPGGPGVVSPRSFMLSARLGF